MLRPLVRWLIGSLQLFVAITVLAGPGDPDPTFGQNGRVVTSFPGGLDTATGVAIQADGKIIVAGSSGSDFAAVRYNMDGTVDSTFGDAGRAQSGSQHGDDSAASSVLIEPDGKIVLAGTASFRGEPTAIAMVRYNANGTEGSPIAGVRFTDDNVFARAVARQSDGKLVVAGMSTDPATGASRFLVVRYQASGAFDTSFGGGFAHVTTDFPGSTNEGAHAIAIQSDGKIVVAGEAGGAFAIARYNADGSPDLLFDGDGMLTTAFDATTAAARGVAIEVDGKIVAVGQAAGSGPADTNFALARYNVDGSPDLTFEGDGKVITDLGLLDGANAVVIQPDGRIVAAGVARSAASGFFAVARYLITGTLDESFGTGGKMLTDFSGSRSGLGATAVALQADGRIVAAGDANSSGQRDFGVVRYNTDGMLDTTFDGDGKASTDFPLNDDAATAMAVQPDGKIIAVGGSQLRALVADAQDPNFQLARYNADGTLDSSFGNGGIVSTDFGSHGQEYAYDVALQPDGRIVVVGQAGPAFSGISDAYTQFAVARYNPDGTLDTTFDGDGLVTTDVGPSPFARARAVAIQPDGGMVVAGTNGQFTLVRYHSNGGVDTSGFGSGGKVTTSFGGSFSSAADVVIQADGGIVAGGVADTPEGTDFALARYDSSGNPDSSFDDDGRLTTDFEGQSDGINDLALQSDGKLVAGGATAGSDGLGRPALARYDLTTATLDSTFGTGGKTTTEFAGSASINGLAVGIDGKIVAAGVHVLAHEDPRMRPSSLFIVTRYEGDGALDESFGISGIAAVESFANFSRLENHANAVVVQADGNIIAGGFTDTGSSRDFALLRLLYDPPARLLNISTRLRVGTTDDETLIGGFIVTGTQPKKVVLRAIGPSLASRGVQGTLSDPTLELFDSAGNSIAKNDDWMDEPSQDWPDPQFTPEDFQESALVRTLEPGSYTAIVRGKFGDTGVALVEVYDIGLAADSQLANISSRGLVETGENVLIGGLILGEATRTARIVVRAIGPSLQATGLSQTLADPVVDLVDENGATVGSNDNWKDSQRTELEATGLQPTNDLEAAVVATLVPANYTAVVRGKNDATGVGVVEVYNVP